MRQSEHPDIVVTGWLGFFVHAEASPEIIQKLQENLIVVHKRPEIDSKFAEMGGIPGGRFQADFNGFVSDEVVRWGDLIKRTTLSLD